MTLTNDQIQALQALSDQGAAKWRRGISRGLHADILQGGNDLLQVAEAVVGLCADVLALRAEVERLREALAPFVKLTDFYDSADLPFPDKATFPWADRAICLGDLRRARTAMEGI